MALMFGVRLVGGEAAVAVATVSAGFVTGITVTSGGSGYMTAPTVVEEEPPNANRIRVDLSQGYWMSDHETKQAKYKSVMGRATNPSCFKRPTLPVNLLT